MRFFILLFWVLISTSCSFQGLGFNYPKEKNIKVALVLTNSLNDSLINTAALDGLKRFKNDYQSEITLVENVSPKESKIIFSQLIKKNFNLIIGLSEQYNDHLKSISAMFPEVFFVDIGGAIASKPNLCSFNFKNFQYGYLLGAVAGLNTSTNKIGIILGDNNKATRKIVSGFKTGLKSTNSKAEILISYINDWNNPTKGHDTAIEQINSGADVVVHYADNSGTGIIKAAEESDISAIGTIVDQHDLAPSTVISSGIQDFSQLIYLACEKFYEKKLKPINYYYGLKDQVIELAPGYGNIDPTVETKINQIKSKLIDSESSSKLKSPV